MNKKIILTLLAPLFLLGCPPEDASSYYPLNTIFVKKQGGQEKVVVQSQIKRFSTFNSTLETPAIAVNKKGNYVIAWTDNKNATRDIYAQRFSLGGSPQGEVILVNSTEAGDQILPAVAINDNDEFVVTWSNRSSNNSGYDVFARKYSSSGTYLGNEFRVNSSTNGDQWMSAVAMNSKGSFVIVWQSQGQDGDNYAIVGQKLDAKAAFVGGEFLINSVTKGSQELPDIDMNSNGEFVVVWKSNQNYIGGVDPNSRKMTDIFAKRFDNKGYPFGDEIPVNTVIGENDLPSVAINDTQTFSAAWITKDNTNNNYDVYAGSFTLNNNRSLSYKVSNFNKPDNLSKPVLGIDNNNKTTIVWNSEINNRITNGIYMKKFNINGKEESSETKINNNGVALQPEMFMEKKTGDYSVVWRQY
ncbi:MAG: hypothetical protein U0457_04525 [Candidatus Sericytochromatia bacterium]